MNERITPYDPELAKSITKEGQRIVRELTHVLEDKISMNKQILEYAEQARLHAKSVIPNSVDDPTSWNYEYHKKFAELIVGECVEQVEQAKNDPFVSLDDAKRMAHFVDVTKKRIEKHFRS